MASCLAAWLSLVERPASYLYCTDCSSVLRAIHCTVASITLALVPRHSKRSSCLHVKAGNHHYCGLSGVRAVLVFMRTLRRFASNFSFCRGTVYRARRFEATGTTQARQRHHGRQKWSRPRYRRWQEKQHDEITSETRNIWICSTGGRGEG